MDAITGIWIAVGIALLLAVIAIIMAAVALARIDCAASTYRPLTQEMQLPSSYTQWEDEKYWKTLAGGELTKRNKEEMARKARTSNRK